MAPPKFLACIHAWQRTSGHTGFIKRAQDMKHYDKLIRKLILIAISVLMSILFVEICLSQTVLEVKARVYKDDSIELDTLRIIKNLPTWSIDTSQLVIRDPTKARLFRVQILDSQGEILFQQNVCVRFYIIIDPIEPDQPGKSLEGDWSILYLRILYRTEMEELRIYHNGHEIYSKKIDL
jgi:hypothetical protein